MSDPPNSRSVTFRVGLSPPSVSPSALPADTDLRNRNGRATMPSSRNTREDVPVGGSVRSRTFIATAAFALSACGGSSPAPAAPSQTNATPTVVSVTVSGSPPAIGAPSPFVATAMFSNGTTQNVTAQATWQSTNPAVVTVSAGGLVTAVAAGDADVTAVYAGATGRAHVTIARPATYTLNGTITATNGGQAIVGASLSLSGSIATSDSSGHYVLMLPLSAGGVASALMVTGAGLIDRRANVQVSTRTVNVDAIALSGGFDQTFYREFVRNTFDAPMTMEPLRRWTRAPMVYLRTIDDSGFDVASNDGRLLDAAEQAVRETVPMWSGDMLSVVSVTRGTDQRDGQDGWLTIHWLATGSTPGQCRNAVVGGSVVNLNYRNQACNCPALGFARTVIRHELGHAMGYWHTDNQNDLMFPRLSYAACDLLPSARERDHAAIAYRRSPGNLDPDTDASYTVLSLPQRIAY
jgi:hypothetical protein